MVKRVPSPAGYTSGEYEPMDDDPPAGFGGADDIVYWYSVGNYCGAGQALLRKGTQYVLIDLGHCSCYGPWEAEHFEYKDAPIRISESMRSEVEMFNEPDVFEVQGK